MARNKSKKSETIDVDTSSGSMSYNRFELQLSESLRMAIELYDSLDYLLVLDYYDDITLFDDDENPQFVSYYQVKSNEESISIHTAIAENWLSKLYAQMQREGWIAKELGLITNCPLKITEHINDRDSSKKTIKQTLKAERTPFGKINPHTIAKIKEDIARKYKISIEEVDLSKFVHMRTTLTITSHREIVQQKMSNFLYEKYSKINVETVKTIYNSMLEIFTKRQKYETLTNDADFTLVRQKKGVSKRDFSRVIEEAIIISIPTFAEIERFIDFGEDKYKASYEYAKLITDSQSKSESFMSLFRLVKTEVENMKIDHSISTHDNLKKICQNIYSIDNSLELLYDSTYICILSMCILINKSKKE